MLKLIYHWQTQLHNTYISWYDRFFKSRIDVMFVKLDNILSVYRADKQTYLNTLDHIIFEILRK